MVFQADGGGNEGKMFQEMGEGRMQDRRALWTRQS
jgi:hypothetical protein